MGPAGPKSAGPVAVPKDRLDSWKEIAAYLQRDVRTVQRWERIWALPIHRLPGGPKAGVFGFRSELDAWMETRPSGEEIEEPPPKRRFKFRHFVWALCALLVLAAAGLGIVVVGNPKILFLSESRFTPFATSLALQTCPTWSPDGKSIAFSTRMEGHSRLMVQALDNSTPIAVTEPDVSILAGGDPVWCRPPFWSPDSGWLYFLGSTHGVGGVYRVAAGGGPATLVQPGALAATISPDGGTLAFLARSSDDQKYKVWTASPPGSSRQPYEPAPYAFTGYSNIPRLAFSPDGTAILSIVTIERGNQYWLLPWPPRKAMRVFGNAESAVGSPQVSWLPDSRHIVFSGGGPLGMANVRSGRYWPVAIQERPMHSPTPSPDGSRVAYQSSLSHADVIAVPLGDGPIQTLLGSSAWEQMPGASPVTQQIVYVTNRRRPGEIWLKSLDEGWDRPLVSRQDIRVASDPAQLLMTPVFSPDGRRIALVASSPAARALFTVSAAGGIPVRATAAAKLPDECCPTWAPDGAWLAFRHATPEVRLAKVRVGSGEPAVDLASSCGSTMPEWSPTGEWIAFPDQNCRVALISPDGKQTQSLGGSGAVAWSRDGKTLYRIDPTAHSLMAVDIATRHERVLRDVGDLIPYSGPQPGLRASLTSDGKSIVYSVLRPREEIWIMEDVQIREPWYAWLLSLVKR
jgi:Tol biopolymer transport system component